MALDEATFAKILTDVTAGSPIRRALADHGVNPNVFYPALDADAELAKRYARAINAGWDAFADDTVHVAEDQSIPPEHKRIMVDTRKWLLAKRLPKRYGDRTILAGDADAPVVIADAKASLLRGLAPRTAGSGETPSSGETER